MSVVVHQVGSLGGLVTGMAELEQSLLTILRTPEGAVPGRPTFGTRLRELLDLPVSVMRPRAMREVTRAVRLHEPRIRVVGVTVLERAPGAPRVLVTWEPSSAGERRTTEVS